MSSGFIIKVSDLLQNIGRSDTIELNGQMSDKIPGLTKEGISGSIEIKSVDEKSIMVTLHDIKVAIDDISDISAEPFIREVFCPEYSTRFVAHVAGDDDAVFDEEFPLEIKSDTIDVEDMIVQCIGLEEPITKMTPEEAKNMENEANDEEETAYEGSGLGGNISFG